MNGYGYLGGLIAYLTIRYLFKGSNDFSIFIAILTTIWITGNEIKWQIKQDQ